MNFLKFLLVNWDSVLVVFVAGASVIILIAKKQYALLDKIIFALVTEAEKKYGDGTGTVKFAAVINWVYPKIPAVIRLFITVRQLERLIESVLANAQKSWNSNPSLSAYIKS